MAKIIALDKNKTLQSVERDKQVDLDMVRTGRKLPYPFFRDTLDQYDLYLKELNNCNNFRLITTIRPYCTNVLFNPLTEVVNNDNHRVCNWKTSPADFHKEFVWTTQNTTDTEKYTYYIGSDIFSNHLLRNISFKAVNNGSNDKFNTMGDTHRDRYKRTIDSQLYEFGDCMPFIIDGDTGELYNCMDYELRTIDGWYGFKNKTNIQTTSNRDYSNKKNNCSSVIGSEIGGKFIQLYPTKDEFLFNPIYNQKKDRIEYNWDVCLTYPYKNYTENELVQEGEWNGLRVKKVSGDNVYSNNGKRCFLITTYLPHNLELGDKFSLSYKIGDTIYEPFTSDGTYLSVMKLGDTKGKNKEYSFMVSEDSVISGYEKLLYANNDYIGDDETNKITFRVRKIRKNVESIYYFRIFRKLPNFKYMTHYLDLATIKDEELLDEYLDEIEETRDGFDNELYPLGFSQTVYNDKNSQLTFTDTITPDILVDNLGRPITEFYTTIIKSNRGYKEWYEDGDESVNDDNIEVSHCFGEVSMGVLCEERYSNQLLKTGLEEQYDVRYIDDKKTAEGKRASGLSFQCNDLEYESVSIDDKFFLGDVVEFNHEMMKEYTISVVNYRFNTWQRENLDNFTLPYEDIDNNDRHIEKRIIVDAHKEGYYYQPHYRVQIKEFGDIKEGEHTPLNISRVNRYDRKGDSDKSAVDADNHNCYLFRLFNRQTFTKSDYIRLIVGDKFYKMNIFYIPNGTTFVVDVSKAKVSPLKNGVVWNNVTDEEVEAIKEYLQNKDLDWSKVTTIWKENLAIPWYAIRHPLKDNKYLWREIYTFGNINCQELDNSVVFANNHIYLNQEIDFFLRRQDPHGYYGKIYLGDLPDLGGDKMQDPPTKETPFNEVIC